MRTRFQLALCVCAAALSMAVSAEYHHAPVSLMTPWGEKITPENAWRNYPRPQMARGEWENLNGLWDYAVVAKGVASKGRPAAWDGEILVPFPIESALSGVGRLLEEDELLWYHRTFKARVKPGTRLLLNFEQVDFRAQVFVNGVELDVPHEGGQVPFSYDITDYVQDGDNDLAVTVWDATEHFFGAIGKQILHPGGISYTRNSGIVGTVWTETVPDTYLANYTVTTDFDAGVVSVKLDAVGDLKHAEAKVEVCRKGEVLATGELDTWAKPITLVLPQPTAPWSPETPNLYDLVITVTNPRTKARDVVRGYFGLRKIEVRKDPKGILRIYFNNEMRYVVGTLDQGWWPDGLLTPPSDEAMAFDILALKRMGFDMMRKHIKVEPRRYYHLCDKLGMLVFQDMPSGEGDKMARYGLYRRELQQVVDHLINVPSIVCWIPYNEGWGEPGEFLAHASLMWVQRHDPSRLVDGPSGAHDYEGGEVWGKKFYRTPHKPLGEEEAGHLVDHHDYSHRPFMWEVNPRRGSFLGEFGAGDVFVKNHIWSRTYDPKDERANLPRMQERIVELLDHVATLARKGLVGSVYTQTTDVENEVNGFLTYDRKVWKFDIDAIAAANRRLREAAAEGLIPSEEKLVFPRLATDPNTWAYTMEEPAGDWTNPSYDDAAWKRSAGGFGNEDMAANNKAAKVSTLWKTRNLWLRRHFTLDDVSEKLLLAAFNTYHDEDAEIYLNGHLVVTAHGFNGDWTPFFVKADAFRAAARKGDNVLAVKVSQSWGGQYFDTELKLEIKK